MDKKIIKKRGTGYWKAARKAGKSIAKWPKWKRDYHAYKKSKFKLLREKEERDG